MAGVKRPDTFLGNEGLAGKIIKKYLTPSILAWMEADDIYQIAAIGMLKAENTFDPKKGIKFSTYAGTCANNEILMELRKFKKLNTMSSLDENIKISKDGVEDDAVRYDIIPSEQPEAIAYVTSKDDLTKMLNFLFNSFSARDTAIYLLLLHTGFNQRIVSKKFGISRSYVSRIQLKIKNKLKNYMESEEISFFDKKIDIKVNSTNIEYHFLDTDEYKYTDKEIDSISELGAIYFGSKL